MIRAILETLRGWWAVVLVLGLALTGEPFDEPDDDLWRHLP